MTTEPIEIIDARGLKCPLPVLKLEKRLASMKPGSELIVLATDPMAKVDIPLYCQKHGHRYVVSSENDALRFAVTVSSAAHPAGVAVAPALPPDRPE